MAAHETNGQILSQWSPTNIIMLCLVPDFGASSVEVYGRYLEKHAKTQHGMAFDEEMSLSNERTHFKE